MIFWEFSQHFFHCFFLFLLLFFYHLISFKHYFFLFHSFRLYWLWSSWHFLWTFLWMTTTILMWKCVLPLHLRFITFILFTIDLDELIDLSDFFIHFLNFLFWLFLFFPSIFWNFCLSVLFSPKLCKLFILFPVKGISIIFWIRFKLFQSLYTIFQILFRLPSRWSQIPI